MITKTMSEDCLWLAERGPVTTGVTSKGVKLILDADFTALLRDDGTVLSDIFTYIGCLKHGRSLSDIIEKGPFENFQFFKDKWSIDGGFYQQLADVDDVLTDYPTYHDKLTCADYAQTLLNYMNGLGRKKVDWDWYYTRLKLTSATE